MSYFYVKDLREFVNSIPTDLDEHLVVLSKDAEGNRFSPLSSADFGTYTPDSTYSGEYRDEEVQKIDFADGEIDEIEPNNAVCLWPTN